jgi:hypothetical protein
MATSSCLCRQRWTTRLILIVSLVAAACGCGPISPRDEFPTPVYSVNFEAIAINGGRFVGQDQWFAAFGPEAASVVSRDVRAPKDGSSSLRVDGSRLDESQGFYFGSYARPINYAPLRSGMPRVIIEGWVGLAGDDGPTCGSGLGLTGTLDGKPVPNILTGIQARDNAFAPYLSNYDGNVVYGSPYTLGEWLHVRAVLDFESRTVEGFVNGASIGTVPFTKQGCNKVGTACGSGRVSEPQTWVDQIERIPA